MFSFSRPRTGNRLKRPVRSPGSPSPSAAKRKDNKESPRFNLLGLHPDLVRRVSSFVNSRTLNTGFRTACKSTRNAVADDIPKYVNMMKDRFEEMISLYDQLVSSADQGIGLEFIKKDGSSLVVNGTDIYNGIGNIESLAKNAVKMILKKDIVDIQLQLQFEKDGLVCTLTIDTNGKFHVDTNQRIAELESTVRKSSRSLPKSLSTKHRYTVTDDSTFFTRFEQKPVKGNATNAHIVPSLQQRIQNFENFKTLLLQLKALVVNTRHLTLCDFMNQLMQPAYGGKILNPATNRYVKATGRIGKSILKTGQ